MARPKLLAIDTETTGLDSWSGDRPFAISTCDENGDQLYVEFAVDPHTRRPEYEDSPALDQMRDWAADSRVAKVFFNGKFDMRMLDASGLGFEWNGRLEEVMFAAHACNSAEPSYKMKSLATKYLGIDANDQKDLRNAVLSARRIAKSWNELLLLGQLPAKEKRSQLAAYHAQGGDFSELPRSIRIAPEYEADYWLPQAILANLPLGQRNKLPVNAGSLCREYCLLDTQRTMLLWLMYEREMKRFAVRHVYDREYDLAPVTRAMEDWGVNIHMNRVRHMQRHYRQRQRKYEHECYRVAGHIFDLESHKELREVLFQERGLTPISFTKQGLPSTDVSVVETYREKDALVKALVIYRSSTKALSTFYDKFARHVVPDHVVPGGKIIHADFKQVGPRTGRFSCQNPNMQQVADAISGRSAMPIHARRPFGPRLGYEWLSYDYSQLEVRIFADLAREEFMLDALLNDRDLHTECANKAWGGKHNPACVEAAILTHDLWLDEPGNVLLRPIWDESRRRLAKARIPREVSAQLTPAQQMQRQAIFAELMDRWLQDFDYDIVAAEKSVGRVIHRNRAKLVLFVKLFGGGVHGIANVTHTSEEETRKFIADYDRAFPRIREFIQENGRKALDQGYIETAFRRKLRVDPDKPYTATNYRIQGSAAELVKNGMIRVHRFLREKGIRGEIILTIHDELVLEVAQEATTRKNLEAIRSILEDHQGLFTTPMPVKIERIATFWDRKKTVEAD